MGSNPTAMITNKKEKKNPDSGFGRPECKP
jgi:hypothetical protein